MRNKLREHDKSSAGTRISEKKILHFDLEHRNKIVPQCKYAYDKTVEIYRCEGIRLMLEEGRCYFIRFDRSNKMLYNKELGICSSILYV